jgi:hypothetical protein
MLTTRDITQSRRMSRVWRLRPKMHEEQCRLSKDTYVTMKLRLLSSDMAAITTVTI